MRAGILSPRFLARWSVRATWMALLVAAAGLSLVPARVVVEAHGTVDLMAGGMEGETATVVVAAPFNGTVRSILRRSGDAVESGTAVALMDTRPLAEERGVIVARLSAARAEHVSALERLVAEEADAALVRTRAEEEANVGLAEARVTGGNRDPRLSDQLRYERDAAEAGWVSARNRAARMRELRALGGVSERALADAEAYAGQAEGKYRAAQAAFERIVSPQSETMAAPALRRADAAVNAAAATRIAYRARVDAARAAADAAGERVGITEADLDRVEGRISRAALFAPAVGVVQIPEGIQNGTGLVEGQPVFSVRPAGTTVARVGVPEWAFTAFESGAAVVVRPTVSEGTRLDGRVLYRGTLVAEQRTAVGSQLIAQYLAPALVGFSDPPFALPTGSTVVVEVTFARGPLVWAVFHAVTAPEGAKLALGW